MKRRLLTYFAFFACAVSVGIATRAFAAEISDVTVSAITANSAVVSWATDISTDATINYGLDPSVGIVRDPAFDKKDHALTLQNLEPLTTYYFRVVSTDDVGNKSATGGFVFKTAPDDKQMAEKIKKQIEQIKDEDA